MKSALDRQQNSSAFTKSPYPAISAQGVYPESSFVVVHDLLG